MAYFEVLHETKLIVDLINKGGFELMWHVVSNTAEYGGMTRRERVVTEESKRNMKQILKEIEDGTFKTQWRQEWADGLVNLKAMEEKVNRYDYDYANRLIAEKKFEQLEKLLA